MRIACFAALMLLAGCVPDLSNICPYKQTITQGVFGEIVDSGALEQDVEVDLYTLLNGMQDMQVANGKTNRAGYQYDVNPSTYMLCAKGVCGTVAVPTGLVEFSAVDAASGLTWDAPVAVPPAQTIGPCTWGD